MSSEDVAEALATNQLVTFRWFAQQYDVPAEQAKSVLQSYAADHDGEVSTVYLVGGSVKGDDSGRMQYKLVEATKLDETRQTLESTTCHVYSLHSSAPRSAADGEALWSLNHQQDRAMYMKLGHESNCLIDNRWSAVKCSQAVVRKGGALRSKPAANAYAAAAGNPIVKKQHVSPEEAFGSKPLRGPWLPAPCSTPLKPL